MSVKNEACGIYNGTKSNSKIIILERKFSHIFCIFIQNMMIYCWVSFNKLTKIYYNASKYTFIYVNCYKLTEQ